MSDETAAEAGQEQSPKPPRKKAAVQDSKQLEQVRPQRSPPEKSKQAQHDREMERAAAEASRQGEARKLASDLGAAEKAADRKWWLDRAMIFIAIGMCLICAVVACIPGPSDEIKSKLFTFFGAILTVGLGYTVGRATSPK